MVNISDKKIWIVIPAYNEEEVIAGVIGEIKSAGYVNIIVVDDGSSDDTYKKAGEIENITVLKHKINRGKGAATKTGIEAAKLLGAGIIVTMDGDGQHDPADIKKLLASLTDKKCDVVLGARSKNRREMPLSRIIFNHLGNFITWYFYGLWVSDSQSGFRAYTKEAANAINTEGDQYEYDSEVIREIHINKLKYCEAPIRVKYTPYSKSKLHQQGFINGVKTLYKMIWRLVN